MKLAATVDLADELLVVPQEPRIIGVSLVANAARTSHAIAVGAHRPGDYLLYFVGLGADPGSNTNPAGWTELASTFDDGNRQTRTFVIPSDGTITTVAYVSGSSVSDRVGLVIVRNVSAVWQASLTAATGTTFAAPNSNTGLISGAGFGVQVPPLGPKALVAFVLRSGPNAVTGFPASTPDNQTTAGTSPASALATGLGFDANNNVTVGNWSGTGTTHWAGSSVLLA